MYKIKLRHSFYGWYLKHFMQRDGALTSLWQYKMPEYISQKYSVTDEIFDVLIVGEPPC